MSKRNMLLGLAAGKVGDLVFYRDGGEQRTRTRVIPKNPRSPLQMAQRVRMANVAALYRLLAPIVRDSFSNRPSNQSGYNAMASSAIELSPFMTKEMANADAVLPMPAVISKGVLPTQSFSIVQGQESLLVSLNAIINVQADASLGEVSQALIDANIGVQEGDVLSFVAVQFSVDELSSDAAIYGGRTVIASLTIDTSAVGELAAVNLALADGNLSLVASSGTSAASAVIAGAVVLSRVDGSGSLQTSFARLALSPAAQTLYDRYRTDEALSDALKSYTGGSESILR